MMALAANLRYAADGGLKADYDNNHNKHLMFIAADHGIPGLSANSGNASAALMAAGGSIFIDLDDVYSAIFPSKSTRITDEGAAGRITMWVDAGYSMFQVSFFELDGVGVSTGFTRMEMPFPDVEQDPSRAGYSLEIASTCAIVKLSAWTKTAEGFSTEPTDLLPTCLGASSSLFSLSWNLLAFETNFNLLRTAINNTLGGPLGKVNPTATLINQTFQYFVSNQHRDTNPTNDAWEIGISSAIPFYPFTSSDSGVSTPAGALFDYAVGGLDINGDRVPDNQFVVDSLVPVNVRFHPTTNQTLDYRVRLVSDVPSGWRIYPSDDDAAPFDKSYEAWQQWGSNDLVTSYITTYWIVSHTAGAPASIDVEFALEYRTCMVLCSWHELDTLTQTFFHTDQLISQRKPDITYNEPFPDPYIDPGSAFPVSVTVTDSNDDPIVEVNLFYEVGNEVVTQHLTHAGGNTWTGQVPAEDTLRVADATAGTYINYWFEARDAWLLARLPLGTGEYYLYINPLPPMPTYTVSGSVKDGSNNPIEGVTVSTGEHSAVTGPTGAYSISGLLAGTYNLTLTKTDYQFSPSPYQFTVSPTQTANFSGVQNHTADTFTYQATEDTYLQEAYPTSAHGSEGCIFAGLEWLGGHKNMVGLLKFGGLTSDQALQGKRVYSAALRLYAASVDGNTSVRLWEIGDSIYGAWNKSTSFSAFPYASMNWYDGTAQGMQGSITIPVSTSNQGTWISTGNNVLLKSGVQAIIDGSDPNYGFLIDKYYSTTDYHPCFSEQRRWPPPRIAVEDPSLACRTWW